MRLSPQAAQELRNARGRHGLPPHLNPRFTLSDDGRSVVLRFEPSPQVSDRVVIQHGEQLFLTPELAADECDLRLDVGFDAASTPRLTLRGRLPARLVVSE